MSQSRTQLWTYELTNDTLSIDGDDGVKVISVYNPSTTSGTVLGNSTVSVAGNSSAAVTVAEGETYTMPAVDATTIDGLTITAPVGCTLRITASI